MRTIVWNLILLALPFALYWSYARFVARKKAETGGTWNEAPVAVLFMTGVALVIASLFYLGLTDGSPPIGSWAPHP